jgi:hypothetical protein
LDNVSWLWILPVSLSYHSGRGHSARGRTFDLRFLNVFYAAGVQEMTYRLRTLRRERTFQIAETLEQDGPSERVVIIEPMTRAWIEDLAPAYTVQIDRLFSASDTPSPDAFRALMASAF